MSVLKETLKKALLLCAVFITFSQSVQAEENPEQKGKVVYQIHYDYEPIYNLLKVSQKEYKQYWEEGLPIAEMKGSLSEENYFDLVYRLKEHDIEWFINNRKPNNQ
ncbi:hypothetical protein ACQKL5_08900 [Peribacillus sp. NPDC097675]|uniref:hypothetical protein n=1 Tax=Peribacillus sp. NPDC097675 TaxID=3390618 RepID=UPI003CFF8A07